MKPTPNRQETKFVKKRYVKKNNVWHEVVPSVTTPNIVRLPDEILEKYYYYIPFGNRFPLSFTFFYFLFDTLFKYSFSLLF